MLSANRAKRVSLHMVTEDGTQLARRYFTENGRKPLTDDDIVRGYEIKKGKYVVVEDDDLERLAPERTRDIDLSAFVDVDDLDPVYFERAYYLAPGPGGAKAYRLLARVMEDTGKAGIATFVMRAKEYLVALIAENGILRAETLRFADELRSPEDVGLPKPTRVAAPDKRRIAIQMKKLAKAKLNPKELEDTAAEKLIKLAEKKRKAGAEVVKAAEARPEDDGVIDLMERLKRSLNTKGGTTESGGRARAKKTTKRAGRKKARARATR
jgi:DNA end-binding protein Ku